MRQLLSDNIRLILNSTTIAVAAIVVLLFHSSCSDKAAGSSVVIECSDSLAVMSTFDVNTIISDSGRISYKIIADEWRIYDKRKPPHWAFEKGVYLEKYDSLMNVEATVKCDTAYYFNEKKLWKLIGNVNIKNPQNEKFYTSLMYWDQNEERIYSDAYIRIEQTDQVTEGTGFSANQNLSVWQINNTKGIYTIEEE
ncbi:MAG: LPS export ABC transporter periplasmic protein LptC [Bacteroidaceae bacterium]|nr:LPS export ABC transporter periplasmic protein LptC [Bacteroidaceae bacterium]